MLKSKTAKFIEINQSDDNGLRWIENIGTAWRFAGFSDDLASLRHKGWFTDTEFQDEVYRGVVYRLPSRNGKPVYFVGYIDPNNDDAARGEIVTNCEDDNDAAHAADNIARIEAEKECEYRAAWQLGVSYNSALETIEAERKTRKELFKELRVMRDAAGDRPDTPAICETVKARIRQTKMSIMAAIEDRRDILKDHYIGRDLIPAFADGAEMDIETAKTLF